MYSFKNDYSDGGHPRVLRALLENAEVQTEGYGEDRFCSEAVKILRKKTERDDIDIHFIPGGTLTNATAISAFLRPHEAVISARSGHIYVHETGSVEATGHKVIPVNTSDGKLTPEQVENIVTEHHFEHMVKPRLVYISQPTETGTLYSKNELSALRNICDEKGLIIFADGARLGSALTAKGSDTILKDYASLCDSFYIGGTKNGALMGEALIIRNESLKQDFRYHMKQQGAMLAKSRSLGIQFIELFRDDLYLKLADYANRMAGKLQDGIISSGYDVMFHSVTNQIFPIFPEKLVPELEKKYLFYQWENMETGYTTIRLVCSWATEEKKVDEFIEYLKKI